MKSLPDIQNTSTNHPKIQIQKVGVRNIKIPFKVLSKAGKVVNTIATISSYCDLVSKLKGINMSRISRTINEVLSEEQSNGFDGLSKFARKLARAHNTDNIWVKAKFDYILKNKTPVSRIDSYEPVEVIFDCTLKDKQIKEYVTVKTVEMSLCPCSKEMSLLKNNITNAEAHELGKLSYPLRQRIWNAGFGAHNQKSIVEVKVELNRSNQLLWIEDIVDIIKRSVSSPTWSTLKRPDEKWVTEVSYLGGYYDEGKFTKVGEEDDYGPKFVEDVVRHIAKCLNKKLDNCIEDYVVVVNNQESIHSDEIMATAVLTAGRNLI